MVSIVIPNWPITTPPMGCQLTAGQLICCVCAAGVVSLGYGSFIEHPGPMLFFLNQP